MLDNGNDVVDVSGGERFGGGVFLHERVEDGDGVFAVGALEEGDGDEEAKGVGG